MSWRFLLLLVVAVAGFELVSHGIVKHPVDAIQQAAVSIQETVQSAISR